MKEETVLRKEKEAVCCYVHVQCICTCISCTHIIIHVHETYGIKYMYMELLYMYHMYAHQGTLLLQYMRVAVKACK